MCVWPAFKIIHCEHKQIEGKYASRLQTNLFQNKANEWFRCEKQPKRMQLCATYECESWRGCAKVHTSTYVKRKRILTHFNRASRLNLPGNVSETVCLNSLGFGRRQRHQCCIELCPPVGPLSPGETLLLSHLTARFIGSSARGCMIPSHLSPDSGVIDSDLCERRLECQRENMCVSSHQLCSAPLEAITTETIRIPPPCCRGSSKTYRTFSHFSDQSTGNFLHVFPALNKENIHLYCLLKNTKVDYGISCTFISRFYITQEWVSKLGSSVNHTRVSSPTNARPQT